VFHATITLLDEWDEENQTVKPGTVVEAVREVYNTYDDKRLIIHLMQPHQPYLGDKSVEISQKIASKTNPVGWNNEVRGSYESNVSSLDGIKQLSAPKHPELKVARDDVWKAYIETLEIALENVDDILDIINGKTVISSDHGELIGESPYLFSKPKYGHPGNHYISELRVVPWFIVDSSGRRKTRSEPPIRYETPDEDLLDSKLEALGYK